MKPTDFKKLIKEAVREAIQEELKDILLEAVRAPKAPIIESPIGGMGYGVANTGTPMAAQPSTTSAAERKAMMESIIGDMKRGQDTISFNSADARGMGIAANTLQVAPGMNTTGEGSKLPEGNVGLDMIMALMNK
jgi:hypothetical protein